MMDELIKEVVRLVAEEHKRAAAEHGAAAHSPHEGYALVIEEVEEDHYGPHNLMYIKKAAVLGACELIQVAAMSEKAILGYESMKEEQDHEKTVESDGKG